MACELYCRSDVTGVIIKPPVKSKNGTGKEYMRFVIGVPNPRIANNNPDWTYIECTVWDINLIRKIQCNYPNKTNVVNIEGEFFVQKFNGSAYAKMFVRDYRVVAITDNSEEAKFTDMDNTVQTFNENSNTEDSVNADDYNKSF